MPALTRRIQGQNGQAIVLVALIMIALFGFLGLAVDGGMCTSTAVSSRSAPTRQL